ncbi:hypothetical protein [Caenimonas soli]|uniref:hypothetical protein n=1 Tax=Caenimonas soli TaxID=2735555 RepID=UPI0015546AC0|nr:hypothetical protein [Caenimonas soli]NPC57823.1 hypothetical protein [Caenimonas soli]
MASQQFDVVLTLEARSNVFLEVVTDHFGLDDEQVFGVIQSSVRELRALLRTKGVEYLDLKPALVPSTDRHERAFLFDWKGFQDSWYGGVVIHQLLTVLDTRSSRSVLVGDWTSNIHPRAILRESDLPLMPPAGGMRGDGVPATLYVVYLNNLTPSMVAAIDAAFSRLPAYAGSVDMTYTSLFKALLSTMLVRDFIQHRKVVVTSNADGDDDAEDQPLAMYDFAGHGFLARSMPSTMYGMLLSYKIERPVLEFDERDSRFSLTAMTTTPHALSNFRVVLEESKLGYLRRDKSGSLKRADMVHLDAAQIADRLQQKLSANYIYNLARSAQGTLKFNMILESGRSARHLLALEYQLERRELRVITFY